VSGFAAVFHLDGAPVDPAWLETMCEALAFRGPDGREVQVSGSVGLCHTLLRTSAETDGRPQIASLDGFLWIAGDVRVDDRETLIAKLPRGAYDLRAASSAELILHAYAAWGGSCVEHLLGDFSFVIWDSRQRRVFAARDQLGVKLLFYAQVGQCLLISNTQDCIRKIRIVPSDVNDRAIGDFLLFGQNKYPAETFFTAIQRLPVAHRLTAGSDGVRTERYWTLPIDEPAYYKRTGDYMDRFRELLRLAVGDRLPTGPLGVFMSGGLDSPLLAATAVQLGAATTAFTQVYDKLIPDQERYYAGLVAGHLGIPIRYRVMDDEPWGWEPDSASVHTPEPWPNPLSISSDYEYYRRISAEAHVFFSGLGPDAALLYEWKPHLAYLSRQRRWGRLCLDVIADLTAYPRIPFFHRLPRIWRERSASDRYVASFPSWFNEEFATRTRLRERWEEIRGAPIQPHPAQPLRSSVFGSDFPMGGGVDYYDAGHTRTPSDFRHPFWDLRLLRFLLTVPAFPWCREKYLMRRSLRGLIPETVRLRPKTPLNGLPYLERVRRSQHLAIPRPELERYVDGNQVARPHGQDRREIDEQLRILGLQLWLLGVQ
jgi:asparagine synthase (glutamine-hydrolysing)